MYQSEYISSKDVGIPVLELVGILEHHTHHIGTHRKPSFSTTRRPRTAHTVHSSSNRFKVPTISASNRQSGKHFWTDKFVKSQTARLQRDKQRDAVFKRHRNIQKTLRPQTARNGNDQKKMYYSQILERFKKLPATTEYDHCTEFLDAVDRMECNDNESNRTSMLHRRWFRRAEAKWRMKKRMREKLELEVKSGRKHPELLDAFDHDMELWMSNELESHFVVPQRQLKDFKSHQSRNLWQKIDTLSKKQLSFSVDPLRSAEIVKCVVEGLNKQIHRQNEEHQHQENVHREINHLFSKQMLQNRENQSYIQRTFCPIDAHFVNNSKFSKSKQSKKVRSKSVQIQRRNGDQKQRTQRRRTQTQRPLSARVQQLSIPRFRDNRLTQLGFEQSDLQNVVIPRTVDRFSECYEAVTSRDFERKNRKSSTIKDKQSNAGNVSKELESTVTQQIFDFEHKLGLHQDE